MAAHYEHEIPEGYEAKIEGNKVIFEPKKSEDEKIRKEIISYIKSSSAITNKKWLAYLEKQKEQKPLSTEETELNSIAFLEQMGYTCIPPGKLQKSTEWSKEYLEEGLRTRFAIYTYKNEDGVLYLSNVFVEEASRNKGFGTKILQATEKVAETIGAITIRLKVKRNSPANDWYRKRGYKYLTVEGEYDWLEKNLEYMKPSKPAEWSEEDKYILKNIHDFIKENTINPNRVNCAGECLNWLISLPERFNLQPKAEWGEVDKLTLDSIISIVEDWESKQSEEEKEYYGATQKSNWLKSLRPSWKPSEEQMDALADATMRDVFPNGNREHLESLYNDLKKLM